MLSLPGTSIQGFLNSFTQRNKWFWPFLFKMFFKGSRCCQQGLDWWLWMLRRRAYTLSCFTRYHGSEQPETQQGSEMSCRLPIQNSLLPFSLQLYRFSHLWDVEGCPRFPVLRAKEMGRVILQPHAKRGQRWRQEVEWGGGPRLWAQGVCINTIGSPRLGPRKAPDQSHTGHAPQRHGPPWVAGRQNAGPQRLWPSCAVAALIPGRSIEKRWSSGCAACSPFPLARLLRGPCPHPSPNHLALSSECILTQAEGRGMWVQNGTGARGEARDLFYPW